MKLSECVEYMKEKHKGQKRKQGTPYYTHPLEVSNILKNKGFNVEFQIAGLFHDLLEDTDITYDDILAITNENIANCVMLVTKEKGYNMEDYIERIRKNEMARMVKLADRIQNLSELKYTDEGFKKKYIAETKFWFISLAKDTVFEDDLNNILNEFR